MEHGDGDELAEEAESRACAPFGSPLVLHFNWKRKKVGFTGFGDLRIPDLGTL